MNTRRKLLTLSAAAVLAPPVALARTPRGDWEALVGDTLHVDGGPRLVLRAVTPGPFCERADNFTLELVGADLAEGCYTVRHPRLGRVPLHLQPRSGGLVAPCSVLRSAA